MKTTSERVKQIIADDSGQAFPCYEQGGNGVELTDAGMTMRDYFAAKAMVALCSMNATGAQTIRDNEHMAEQAYAMADAMLKARSA